MWGARASSAVPFATPDCVHRAEVELAELTSKLPDTGEGLTFSACEVFTNPPTEIARGKPELAWHLVLNGRSSEVGIGRRPGCDLFVEVDWERALPVARLVYTEAILERVAAERRTLEAAGTRPDQPRLPPAYEPMLIELHNRMVAHTAPWPEPEQDDASTH